MKVALYVQKLVPGAKSKYPELEVKHTTTTQHLPETYNKEQSKFLFLILYKYHSYDYPLSLICNMNKTAVSFNITNATTIEEKVTKTISIVSTEHERSMFTVVLACLADGTKLLPLIIFKLVKVLRKEFPNNVIVRVNSSG
ncbi:1682_t:CDS:2 [Scutellospora calospora]|uniref:1682_t:CDS:1 n=1 Tax=Scutellospora calospora TaxID=85575 RepID=A0ACA9K0S0_9GLOM|nr:1682_t:CDS:2 [Scutellospora calospora]